ncbi:PREDICTED: major facilitator superfamily domain-containing protein 6-B-like isoform X2 [Diuraphis noxia]|uniref:major facilitator superfamily domain-containing protein 6-B-like isoform X2 n=1 Tax=Diuraphis noxia TaxID=143948 RepID=UPI00076379AB|nr:PREDICTED: major facilitator superfamily domain-containing protein 6-B-like isoform X2 [Diuraphis noxia]
MTSFLPTIAKQLGYSTVVVGTIYSILPILSLIIKPIIGAIVDQFRVKKLIFLMFILLSGLTAFSLMFVPSIPLDSSVELNCNSATYLNVCPEDNLSLSNCSYKRVTDVIVDKFGCELKCKNSVHFSNEMCSNWGFNDYCELSNSSSINNIEYYEPNSTQIIKPRSNKNYYNDDYVYLFAMLEMAHSLKVENCLYFRISSASFYFNNSEVIKHTPVCNSSLRSQCQIQCNSEVIMDLIIPQKFKGSVLELSQFWIFFLLISLFWVCQAIIYSLGDSICFDQLGNKPNMYGKQRCWGAIGWGIFSIFAGWLLDLFSSSEVNKNYLPIYYLCLLVLLGNFFVASKLEVTETKISTNIFKDFGKLLVEIKVLGFLTWAIGVGICTGMIWQYLFWYVEDVASMNECNTQHWIKTLQGLISGVQCFGGEVPFFFWSGWIIKRLGHLNCMSLVLGVFAFRFFAYSILTNPIWVLVIELTNGITFGLAYAVLMSYASILALPGSESTMIGLVGGVFEGIGVSLGSLIGGCLYDKYGGAETFRLFAYGSALLCAIHLLCQKVLKANRKLSLPNFIGGSTEYASPNEAIHMLIDN